VNWEIYEEGLIATNSDRLLASLRAKRSDGQWFEVSTCIEWSSFMDVLNAHFFLGETIPLGLGGFGKKVIEAIGSNRSKINGFLNCKCVTGHPCPSHKEK